ncbi:MAG: histidine phosphatase family protein [Spirochaetes bacterium]|nr:histidine phosphatase family protein [Spirochaetota bacterium]
MYSRLEVSNAEGADAAPASSGEAFAEVADGGFFATLDHPISFYIVRHGRSEGNATMTFQGRLDYPLDALGFAQAQAAAAWFAGLKIDAVLTSPLRRASDTAGIIGVSLDRTPIVVPSLIEVDVGIFSGIPAERAEAEYAEIYGEFEYRSWDAVPGAENSTQMYARAITSWKKMRELAEGGARAIVCVTHGGSIQWLVRSTFGARSWLPLIPTSNCGISQYDVVPTRPGFPAFIQWTKINFSAPGTKLGTKPLF